LDRIVTITDAPSSADLTTLANVKDDLGMTTVDATRDATLTRYITDQSVMLATLCNRVFGSQTISEKFRLYGEATSQLILTHRPITTLTSVTEDDDPVLDLVGTDKDVEIADSEAGLLRRLDGDDGVCTWSGGVVTVVYVAGYALPASAPVDLAAAARALVKAQWLGKGRDPMVRSEVVPGVYEVAYWVGGLPGGAAWPMEVQAAITAHRNWSA
jgi:hypothetical protein